MKPDVIAKLKEQLKKNIRNEPQIVYILTRIGKILEFENSKEGYPVLNFYRNWSVHTKINDAEPVASILKEFIEKKENRYLFSIHQQFCSELITFLKKHDLPNLNKNRLNNFIFYLGKVISDTPINISFKRQQYSISICEPIIKESSGLYTITLVSKDIPTSN